MSHPSFGELGGEDPYAILELAPHASDDDIRRARRRLLRRYHPDLPGGDLETTQKITAAADVLLDRVRRLAYEDSLQERAEAVFAGPVATGARRVPPFHNPFDGAFGDGDWHPMTWHRKRGGDEQTEPEWPSAGVGGAHLGGAHRAGGGAGLETPTGDTPADEGVPRQRARGSHGDRSETMTQYAGERLSSGRAALQWGALAFFGALERTRTARDEARGSVLFAAGFGFALLVVYVAWAFVR